MPHSVGDLAEVLDNLGVFSMHPEEVLALCPSGFRRVPITSGDEFYLSSRGSPRTSRLCAHPPGLGGVGRGARGLGKALLADNPVPLEGSLVIGRATAHPHGFVSGDGPMTLLSIQLPRPSEPATTWDQPGRRRPDDCHWGARAGAARCGGHSHNHRASVFVCENCTLEF